MMKGLSDKEFALNLRKLRDAADQDLVVSPINLSIVDRNVLKLPQLKWFNFHLMPSKVKVTNTGHTVILSAKWLGKRPHINQGPLAGDYVFSQIHFHWGQTDDSGSEHLVDGKQYPLEMHVVYFKSDYGQQAAAIRQKDGLLVIGYFFKIEDVANPTLADVILPFPLIARPDTSAHVNAFRPDRLCPPFRDDYFLYHGSVTSAACNHQVLWAFNREPISVSSQQVASFRQLLDHTGAPLMTHARQADPSCSHAIFHVNPSHIRSGVLYPLSSGVTPARVAGSSLATVAPAIRDAGAKQGQRNASLKSSSSTSPPAPPHSPPPPPHRSKTRRSLHDSAVPSPAKKRWVSANSRSTPEPLPSRRMKPTPARHAPSVRELLPPDVDKFRRDDDDVRSTSTLRSKVVEKQSMIKKKTSRVVAETNVAKAATKPGRGMAVLQIATSKGTAEPTTRAVKRATEVKQKSNITAMINEPWKKIVRPGKVGAVVGRQLSQAGTELGPTETVGLDKRSMQRLERAVEKPDTAVARRELHSNDGQRTEETLAAKTAFPSWSTAHSAAISRMVNYCKKLKKGKSDSEDHTKLESKSSDEHGTVVMEKSGDETSKSSSKKKERFPRENDDEDRQSSFKRPPSTTVAKPFETEPSSSLQRRLTSKHRRSHPSKSRHHSSLRQRSDVSNGDESPNRSRNNSAATQENLEINSQVTVLMNGTSTSDTGNTSAAGVAALASRLTDEAVFRSAWARGSVAQASRHDRWQHSLATVRALGESEDNAVEGLRQAVAEESAINILGPSASRKNSSLSADDKSEAVKDCQNRDNPTDPNKPFESLYFIPYETSRCKDKTEKTLKTVVKFNDDNFSDNSALPEDMNGEIMRWIGKSSNVAIEPEARTTIVNRHASRKNVELPKRFHEISPDFDLVQESVCYVNSEAADQCALDHNVSDLLNVSQCRVVSSVNLDCKVDPFRDQLLESVLRNDVGRNRDGHLSSRNLQVSTLVYTAAESASVSWPPNVQSQTSETSDKQSSCNDRTSRENDVNRLREGRSLWPSQPLCWGRGKLQSPISIESCLARDIAFPPLVFRHHFNTVGQATLRNHGNRAEMTFTCQNQPSISGGPLVDGSYEFESLIVHWHNPESSANRHSVDNNFYTAEVHLVHYLHTWGSYENAIHEPHGLAVIAFFLESGCTEDLYFEDLISALAKIPRPQTSTKLSVETMKFLENFAPTTGYFAYPGSMTDHPHADDVVWIVYPRPVMVSRGQIEAFRSLSNHACSFTKPTDRCQQPLNERPVFYSV